MSYLFIIEKEGFEEYFGEMWDVIGRGFFKDFGSEVLGLEEKFKEGFFF